MLPVISQYVSLAGAQAYTLPYVLPSMLAVVRVVVLLVVLVRVFGVRLNIWV